MVKETKKLTDKSIQRMQEKPILEIPEHSEIRFEEAKENVLVFTESDEPIIEDLEPRGVKLLQTTKGIEITTSYNVGVREFSKFILKVIPKKVGDIEALGRMIAFCYMDKVKTFDLENIRFQKGDGPLEWLIMAFVQLTQRLIRKGLYRKYVTITDDVSYLKGKLLLKQQIQNTMKFNMKFHCEYDDFTSNNKENQIILHTLKKCLILSKKSELKTKIQKLIHQIDRQVEDKIIRMDDFKQIHYTRLNSRYRTPLVLSKLILEQTGFKNIKEMKDDAIVPFFVYMPRLFERFLEKMFQDYYSELNVKKQDNRNPWVKEPETEDKIGEIEPDLVLYKDSLEDNSKPPNLIRENVKMVIDAKYMEEPKRDARFQIAFYLHEYDVKRGFAICPTQEKTFHRDSQNRIVYKDDKAYLLKAEYQNREIAVRHINVNQILDELIFSNVSENEISRIMKELIAN